MKKIIAIFAWLGIGYYIGKGVAERKEGGKSKKQAKLDKFDALNQGLEGKN